MEIFQLIFFLFVGYFGIKAEYLDGDVQLRPISLISSTISQIRQFQSRRFNALIFFLYCFQDFSIFHNISNFFSSHILPLFLIIFFHLKFIFILKAFAFNFAKRFIFQFLSTPKNVYLMFTLSISSELSIIFSLHN